MRRRVSVPILIGISVALGLFRGGCLRPEPDWPSPPRYLTEVYDKERGWPDCPVVIVPEFRCRTAGAQHEPIQIRLPDLKPQARYAYEGTVRFPEWSEPMCMIRWHQDPHNEHASSKIGATAIRQFDGAQRGSFRKELRAPRTPGRYRVWLEFQHPRGEPGDQLDMHGGADALTLRTIVAEGELVVTE